MSVLKIITPKAHAANYQNNTMKAHKVFCTQVHIAVLICNTKMQK
jgi:hypothetical protein